MLWDTTHINIMTTKKTLREIVEEIKPNMQCNCDLDNWEPEQSTGHSWVCRIHKEALRIYKVKNND
jgi:hypothetical protein